MKISYYKKEEEFDERNRYTSVDALNDLVMNTYYYDSVRELLYVRLSIAEENNNGGPRGTWVPFIFIFFLFHSLYTLYTFSFLFFLIFIIFHLFVRFFLSLLFIIRVSFQLIMIKKRQIGHTTTQDQE